MAKGGGTERLDVVGRKGVSDARRLAEVAADPTVTAGYLAATYAKGITGTTDLTELVGVVRDAAERARGGDLGELEVMLAAQATALNAIFGELARRSAANLGEYINAADRYLRLALKAQAQCRATVETLAAIKNPPVVFAKQANIAAGPQQVNNGTSTPAGAPARAGNPETVPNGLLEANGGSGERLDAGTAGAAIGGGPALAAMGAVDRPADP